MAGLPINEVLEDLVQITPANWLNSLIEFRKDAVIVIHNSIRIVLIRNLKQKGAFI